MEELNCNVVQVDHNQIANKMRNVLVRGPTWEGKSWWQVLTSEAEDIIPLPYDHIKFSQPNIFPRWEFALGIFVF